MRATLPITPTDLPPHIAGITVAHLTLLVVRADGFAGEQSVLRTQKTWSISTSTPMGNPAHQDKR